MSLNINISTGSSVPIYKQITDQVRLAVATGKLSIDDQLPSVRALAEELVLNPNTVARAYQRLTEGGVLAVKRGEGTYVADVPVQPRKNERNEALRDAAVRYASTAIAVGSELEDAVDEVESAYERVVREHRRKA